MNQVNGDLCSAVRKRTELLVLAILEVAGILIAELAFVTTRMVELLYFVMSLRTAIAEMAQFVIIAEDMFVVDVRSASVLWVMVVQTGFKVVGI